MRSHLLRTLCSRPLLVALATLLGLAVLSYQCSQWASAQQAADESLEETDDARPPAAAGDRPSAATTAAEAGERTLFQSLMLSGFSGLIIFLLSMVGVGFIVEHALTIRKNVLMPEDLIADLDELLAEGRTDEAIAVCQQPEHACLFSQVVLAGLERFKGSEFGFAEYRAAAEEAGEDQTARLYRKTEVLGVIGAIAPMFGLLGTVSGMIKAFDTIAATGGMARPHQLAGGISEALITTFMGLVVAIPAMVAFSYFRNKIDSLVAEAGKRVEQVLAPLGRRR